MAIGIAAAAVATITLHHESAQARVPLTAAITQEVDGKAVYLKSCKECHGVLGAPTKASLRKYEKIPDFTDTTFFKKRKHEELTEAVEKGKGRDMKGFTDKLSKEEIKAVVVYIHTLEKKG
jgi:mono/diheme cytochrome c family protein